jgi:hypothetical protein
MSQAALPKSRWPQEAEIPLVHRNCEALGDNALDLRQHWFLISFTSCEICSLRYPWTVFNTEKIGSVWAETTHTPAAGFNLPSETGITPRRRQNNRLQAKQEVGKKSWANW